MECTAHQRSEYQVPAKHDRVECLHVDPLCEIESHEGFVAADARMCSSSSLHPVRSSGRGRALAAKWSSKPYRLVYRTTAPNTTTHQSVWFARPFGC